MTPSLRCLLRETRAGGVDDKGTRQTCSDMRVNTLVRPFSMILPALVSAISVVSSCSCFSVFDFDVHENRILVLLSAGLHCDAFKRNAISSSAVLAIVGARRSEPGVSIVAMSL